MNELEELCEQYGIWLAVDGFDGYQFAVAEGEHGEVSLHITYCGQTVDHVTLGIERLEGILFGFYTGFAQCAKHISTVKGKRDAKNITVV